MKKTLIGLLFGALFLPFIASAQTATLTAYQNALVRAIALLQQEVSLLEMQLANLHTSVQTNNTPTVEPTSTPANNPPVFGAVSSPTIDELKVAHLNKATGDFIIGETALFTPFISDAGDSVDMEFSTDNPDGFKRVGGYKAGETPTVQDQAFNYSTSGKSGSIASQLNTAGTFTYTLTVGGVSKAVQITVR